ncbi:P1 family peptidase [Brevibacillus agri]|uniref:P1 family peptidase n=1 Tax=Brevibacillus TaxID=55080 RepID=UPI000271BB5D|nr:MULTISPECIES: P1 family peptidase [Brevibacillus]EJL45828.1 L-aminopeptidase/D-esterase [Brevibacillus sp. CF112]MED1646892.1 P1 family peptidase [Brevibacillus agri]MED1657875.1 P1 family peptidase [Brevibacillus agri]MED1686289.1 P1 family peptidase [Brevibacillus agri]MED1695242.1 P1 family peptidase [Brevibacillus agri]
MTGTIVDVPGIRVGHAQNEAALTGCSVVLLEKPSVCGVDVRGSAPGTRETDLLDPLNLVSVVHAICLSGGSAYGLDAASGVMQYLEEKGIGLDVGYGVVPIVPAAVLFDLAVGDYRVRPDRQMGYQAALAASSETVAQGNVGAGTGASVGKLNGFAHAMKSGLGSASLTLPSGLVIGALVAVNAVGHVMEPKTGVILAGPRDERGEIRDSMDMMLQHAFSPIPPGTNTTIAVVASNAKLTKAQAQKVAQMAHDGLARTIRPIHTMYDGDTIFAVATDEVGAAVDLVGALSADVLAEAVIQAVKAAKEAGGLPAWSSYDS